MFRPDLPDLCDRCDRLIAAHETEQDRQIKLLWNVTDAERTAIERFLSGATLHPVLIAR